MAIETPNPAPPLTDSATRVVDATLAIIQQELELARLELVDKLPKLGGGIVRLALAAVLVMFGGMFAVLPVVWALADYVFGFQHVWASFAVGGGVLLIVAAYLARIALARARAAGPPISTAALRQARALRETVRFVSLQRTVEAVERSLEASREELASALADVRAGAAQRGDVRSRAERYVAEVRERVLTHSDDFVPGALVVGFVGGGGVSGTLHMPVKLARVAVGRPSSRSGLESVLKQAKYSKQVGRALAGVAAADRQIRSPRARLWRLIRPTPRRLVLLGSAGGGAFMAMTDDETRKTIETETRALLETVGAELTKRLETVGK